MALSLKVKDSFGWPYTTTGVWMRGDFYGPATTLESNVKRLHEEVYGQTDYVVPKSIVEISNKIIATNAGNICNKKIFLVAVKPP